MVLVVIRDSVIEHLQQREERASQKERLGSKVRKLKSKTGNIAENKASMSFKALLYRVILREK